jgi:uncharacterized protein
MEPNSIWTPGAGAISFDQAAARVSAFLQKVYGWMFVGLLVTAAVAGAVVLDPAVARTLLTTPLYWVFLIGDLGLVFFLSFRVAKIRPTTAMACFVGYAALNGIVLAPVFLVYTGASIAATFVVTAGMFGAMALWGSVTKKNLAGMGQFMFMGLIGLILASVVGMFWHNGGLQFAISAIGVVVFVGLTAWDAQKMKALALQSPDGATTSFAVVGALALYLDFINLFLFLLRFMGGRRD